MSVTTDFEVTVIFGIACDDVTRLGKVPSVTVNVPFETEIEVCDPALKLETSETKISVPLEAEPIVSFVAVYVVSESSGKVTELAEPLSTKLIVLPEIDNPYVVLSLLSGTVTELVLPPSTNETV